MSPERREKLVSPSLNAPGCKQWLRFVALPLLHACMALALLALAGRGSYLTAQTAEKAPTPHSPAALVLDVKVPFRLIAYGDTRFHNPADNGAADPTARVALVNAIANADPAFICFTGDIVYNGYDQSDWKTFENETSVWRDKHIPVFPALGNHEFHGDERTDLANYFAHFPDLKNSRYYSLRAANTLLLVLDSSQEETSGPKGEWLVKQLDTVPSDVDFVFIMLHHPPYTSSSMNLLGEGHSARETEKELARLLEERQPRSRARFVVLSGHVHNYERHEHGGVTYFVSGGGGAHAYPVRRARDDPYQSNETNYHYLLLEVDQRQLKVTMNRVQFVNGKAIWTQPDSVTITVPAAKAASAGNR